MKTFIGTLETPFGDQLELEMEVLEKIESIQEFEKETTRIVKDLLYDHYLYSLLELFERCELYISYNYGLDVPDKKLRKIVWTIDKPKYKCIDFREK